MVEGVPRNFERLCHSREETFRIAGFYARRARDTAANHFADQPKSRAYRAWTKLGPIHRFAGTFPLALEPWFNVAGLDKAQELKLQKDFRAPNPDEEQKVVAKLTPISNQIRSSGFGQMCRDDRTDAFFSRCIVIQFKTDADLAAAKPIFDMLSTLYKNVVIVPIGVITPH